MQLKSQPLRFIDNYNLLKYVYAPVKKIKTPKPNNKVHIEAREARRSGSDKKPQTWKKTSFCISRWLFQLFGWRLEARGLSHRNRRDSSNYRHYRRRSHRQSQHLNLRNRDRRHSSNGSLLSFLLNKSGFLFTLNEASREQKASCNCKIGQQNELLIIEGMKKLKTWTLNLTALKFLSIKDFQ